MQRSASTRAGHVALALTLFACAERRPSTEASTPSSPATLVPSSSASAPSAASSANQPAPAVSVSAGVAESEPAQPPLLDSEGKPLPQTEERPRADSAVFQHMTSSLFQAIVRDDPSLAQAVFFPVVAYEQVKAVANPARDWQQRLLRAFERNVHEYHRALGRDPERATLIGIEVPEASVRWMKPGAEGNRLGYFRVLRSRLRVAKADGKEHTFEVTSMISWRGEWYVVHLHGFD